MRRAGPVALLGASAALAAAGVGLLLPLGGSGGGTAAVGTAVAGTAAVGTAVAAGPGQATRSVSAEAAGSATGVPGTQSDTPDPSPADRLAGPVPDDEIALAFAAAVPAAHDLDPAAAAEIIDAASAGLAGWYADAGWQDVSVQAAVVTEATTAAARPDVTAASVAALWSGNHPVLGPTDRRYATVTLTADKTTTADDPGAAWTVDSIEGGAGDG